MTRLVSGKEPKGHKQRKVVSSSFGSGLQRLEGLYGPARPTVRTIVGSAVRSPRFPTPASSGNQGYGLRRDVPNSSGSYRTYSSRKRHHWAGTHWVGKDPCLRPPDTPEDRQPNQRPPTTLPIPTP